MTPTNRAILISSLLTGAAAGVGMYLMTRAKAQPRRLPVPAPQRNVIPILSPVIYPRDAGAVLSHLERLPEREPITLVLHTLGGCAISSVMIADAVRRFDDVTAVVPYMALSGGTIIALGAKRIELGKNAALSAVDPMIHGIRARHIPNDPPGMRAMALEYEEAIRRHVAESLATRLSSTSSIARALQVFMGEEAPHEWPIRAPQLAELGLDVGLADRRWADYVDAAISSRPSYSIHVAEEY